MQKKVSVCAAQGGCQRTHTHTDTQGVTEPRVLRSLLDTAQNLVCVLLLLIALTETQTLNGISKGYASLDISKRSNVKVGISLEAGTCRDALPPLTLLLDEQVRAPKCAHSCSLVEPGMGLFS